MKNQIILGIETSCDETSLALCFNGKIVKEITTSSMNIHSNFGGVVPEIATRYHQQNIHKIFYKLIEETKVNPKEITHIVYTNSPGLPGCLHIGQCFAKTLQKITNAELFPVNHLYGHLFSGFIDSNEKIEFPLISLVISGGHTTIYYVKEVDNIEILNETQDDAAGEVLDKVARALGFGYPGGPIIDKNFDINKATINLLKNNFSETSMFSFSGIKTAALNYINSKNLKNEKFDKFAIASTVQKIIVDDVIKKMKYWIKQKKCNLICLGGGVSANSYLRDELQKLNVNKIILPKMQYTGDQATMIAFYGNLLINFKTHHK